jgi:hypothetical protein
MRRATILMTTLALTLSGLVFSPVQAAIPSDGTYLCTTGMPSSSTPNYTIADGVVSDGRSCAGSVVIPDGVTSIGVIAFQSSSITSIAIPSSVTSIGNLAFNAARLTSVTIPSSVTSIGDLAFAYSVLTSITIPSSVTSIGVAAFWNSSSLTSATFSSGVTSIPPMMFESATALTSVTIPSSVTNIGSTAFGLTALTSVTIPASVTSISSMAFYGASALGSVYFLGNAPSVEDQVFLNTSSGAKAYIKSGATGFGSAGANWNGLTVTNVAADGTYLCTSGRASSATPNFRITNFEVSQGSSCSGAVVIPDGVTSIGSAAFQGSSISSIAIPSSVTSIGDSAFNATRSLASVTIPSSVTSIGEFAFSYSALTSITIPSSVTSIGIGVFYDTPSLTSATFLSGATRIPDLMFERATALTSVTIPSSVTSIGSTAFYGTALSSVTIPASVTRIEIMAFYRASALGSVYFLGNAPSVEDQVFSNISSGAKAHIESGATGFGGAGANWNGLIVEVVADPPAAAPVVNSAPAPVSNSAPAIETPAQVVDTGLAARTIGSKKRYSAKTLAKQVGIKMISPKATVSISASKSSKKVCTKSGARLRTLNAGNCVVTFTVQEPKPKKGKKPKSTKTTTTLVVR